MIHGADHLSTLTQRFGENRTNGPSVLAVGPWDQREFAIVRDAVDPRIQWPTAPSLPAAIDQMADGDLPPELVLLAQPRPGVDDQAVVDRLQDAAPLTRLIVVAGSWCEGEFRTGRPLRGVVRLYWYELPAWWRHALALVEQGTSPPWSVPLDDLRAGQMVGGAPASIAKSATTSLGIIAIDARDFAAFEALQAALATFGWSSQWQPRHRREDGVRRQSGGPITAGIWDGGQLSEQEFSALSRFCKDLNHYRAPVVALLDFPRAEHVGMIQSAGAASLFGKPYQAAILASELHRLVARR